MKIGLITYLNCHYECFAFLLESLSYHDITIIVKENYDSFNYLHYYSSLYNFNVCYGEHNKTEIMEKYDKVFKITSQDGCVNNRDVISLLHLKHFTKSCKSKKLLSLTPYVNGPKISYTFPVYCPIIKNSINNKTVTMVGYYSNDCIDDDTKNFINSNPEYIFNFVINNKENCYDNLKNLKNVKLFHKVNAVELCEIVNQSKYILSRKFINYDRFSGQLGLAISFEKPLLLDSKTKTDYNLPGIGFQKEYCEIGNLNNIADEEYTCLLNGIKIFKVDALYANKKILTKLIYGEDLLQNEWLAYKKHWTLLDNNTFISLVDTCLKKNTLNLSELKNNFKMEIEKGKKVLFIRNFNNEYFVVLTLKK